MILANAPHAQEKPLWEAGIGAGVLTFPDYRGSDHRQTYVLPVPYIIYRGEFLKADRNGVRGIFFNSDRVDLNVSVNASAPVYSTDNPTREGMPDLKPTFEVGPSLDFTLWRSAVQRMKLDLRLPCAPALPSKGSGTRWVFSPGSIGIADATRAGWCRLARGPLYGDQKQHRYYYLSRPNLRHRAAGVRSAQGLRRHQFLAAVLKRFHRSGSAGSSATTRCQAPCLPTARW
jgi:hypothetical protein